MAAAHLNAPPVAQIYSCGKITFEHRKRARLVMNDLRKPMGIAQSGKGQINVYWCGTFRGWHIGHLRKLHY